MFAKLKTNTEPYSGNKLTNEMEQCQSDYEENPWNLKIKEALGEALEENEKEESSQKTNEVGGPSQSCSDTTASSKDRRKVPCGLHKKGRASKGSRSACNLCLSHDNEDLLLLSNILCDLFEEPLTNDPVLSAQSRDSSKSRSKEPQKETLKKNFIQYSAESKLKLKF